MKLLVHNFLQSNVKGVNNPYPLKIQVDVVEIEDNEFSKEFLINMISRINYTVLVAAAMQANYNELPQDPPQNPKDDEAFLKKLHHALMNVKKKKKEKSFSN